MFGYRKPAAAPAAARLPLAYRLNMEAAIEGEETLESLLEASREPDGRSRLASAGTLATLLGRLSTISPADLLPILRILRNLCAGEDANQMAFINLNGSSAVNAVLGSPLATPQTGRVGLQLLGNVALAGEEHRASVWAALFPVRFLELARVRDLRVCDPLCMVLDTCCSSEGGRRRVEELCDEENGLAILIEIIMTASTGGYREEWLEWLIIKVCIEESYFMKLFQNLGPYIHDYGYAEGKNTLFTTTQAFVLRLLSKCLSERPGDISLASGFSLSVLKILKESSNVMDFFTRGASTLPTGIPTIDVLGYSLMILRDACAWEDPSLGASIDQVNLLLSAGLLDFVLSLLRELEPPSIVIRSMANNRGKIVLTEDKKLCPYRGFRRDLVSVICNCLHKRKQVQDEIREKNGIPLLLQQCVIDDDNPFLREWGLLAVRNLLEGNKENQQYVAELQLQDPVTTPEISGLGLKVEVDKKNGCPKLVKSS